MTKYIVKTTYLDGIHAGKEFYLIKGGYVRDNLDYIRQEDSYSLSACKAVCARYAKNNEINVRIEKQDREYAIAHGKTVSKYPIYNLEKYEPFAIETVDR